VAENTESEFVGEEESFHEYFNFSEHKASFEDFPDGYKVIHLQEIEKIVWTGLTEQAANQFVNRKQHNYPDLYTYVESAYWSPQLVELQEWIKGLTDR